MRLLSGSTDLGRGRLPLAARFNHPGSFKKCHHPEPIPDQLHVNPWGSDPGNNSLSRSPGDFKEQPRVSRAGGRLHAVPRMQPVFLRFVTHVGSPVTIRSVEEMQFTDMVASTVRPSHRRTAPCLNGRGARSSRTPRLMGPQTLLGSGLRAAECFSS